MDKEYGKGDKIRKCRNKRYLEIRKAKALELKPEKSTEKKEYKMNKPTKAELVKQNESLRNENKQLESKVRELLDRDILMQQNIKMLSIIKNLKHNFTNDYYEGQNYRVVYGAGWETFDNILDAINFHDNIVSDRMNYIVDNNITEIDEPDLKLERWSKDTQQFLKLEMTGDFDKKYIEGETILTKRHMKAVENFLNS